MGKSLKGKELGKNISQRKDGRYQARFINRFGQRQTIYANTLNEIRSRLREEQYNDAKEINVVSNNVTLDEWFKIWLDTIDFKDKLLHVRHTLCYFSKDGKYVFEIHDTKTDNGERTIPLTDKAFRVLKKQRIRKQEIIF